MLFSVLLAAVSTASAATSDLWGKAGERWSPASPLPDFSFAGYRMGTAEPVAPEARVSVKDFGATGDGTTDDTEAILKAITAAPGKVIFFPPGRYVITKFLPVTQSGTVLQGAGAELTTLLMPVPMNTISPRVYNNPASSLATTLYSWSGGMISLAGQGYAGETLSSVAAAAKRGDTTLQVADASKLETGTRVVLEQNDDSARTLVAHVYRGDPGDLSKLKETYALSQVLTVVKIEGQTLTVDRPLRADSNTGWTPVLKRYSPTLENCGVEHLTIEFPATPYRGHWTEEGYNPVEIKGAADCWLRGLKIVNPDSGPFVIGSVFCTLDGIEFVSTRKAAEEDIQGHHGISLMGVDCLCRHFTIDMKFFTISPSRRAARATSSARAQPPTSPLITIAMALMRICSPSSMQVLARGCGPAVAAADRENMRPLEPCFGTSRPKKTSPCPLPILPWMAGWCSWG